MSRPMIALDLETTGTSPTTDRIIEVGIVSADASRDALRWLVNPGVPIPTVASSVHGIGDEQVATAPTFAEVAHEVADALRGCDLVGFNLRAFDLPMLRAEFDRAGVPWPCEGARVVDVFALYRDRERHTLGNAVRFYCGREHEGAHGAVADAAATLDVLDRMLLRYPDLPGDIDGLDRASGGRQPDWATACGRIRWDADGRPVFAFGKASGRPVANDRGFAAWVIAHDFPADVKELLRRVLRGEAVERPAGGAL